MGAVYSLTFLWSTVESTVAPVLKSTADVALFMGVSAGIGFAAWLCLQRVLPETQHIIVGLDGGDDEQEHDAGNGKKGEGAGGVGLGGGGSAGEGGYRRAESMRRERTFAEAGVVCVSPHSEETRGLLAGAATASDSSGRGRVQ
jgi:hypothetical protein